MNSRLKNPHKYFFLSVLLLVILITSCAKPGPVIVPGTINDLGKIDSAEILRILKEQEEEVHTVKGLALARLQSPDDKVSFRQVTIVESPNKLRLEALAPLGTVELAVISDGRKVLLKFPKDDVLYNQLEAFNFSVFYPNIPVPINIDHLSRFLLGRLPVDLFDYKYEVEVDESNNQLILNSTTSESKLWVDFKYFRIKKAAFLFDDTEEIVVHYSNFISFESFYFPREIELNLKDYSIFIKYDYDVVVNEKVRQSLFEIDS